MNRAVFRHTKTELVCWNTAVLIHDWSFENRKKTNKRELVKTTRTFDLVKTRTSKQVAIRKTWAKFGLSKNDSKGISRFTFRGSRFSGPQDSTTIIAEEVTMRFIHADQELLLTIETEKILPFLSKGILLVTSYKDWRRCWGGRRDDGQNQAPGRVSVLFQW